MKTMEQDDNLPDATYFLPDAIHPTEDTINDMLAITDTAYLKDDNTTIIHIIYDSKGDTRVYKNGERVKSK